MASRWVITQCFRRATRYLRKGLAEENFKPLGFVRMAYIDRKGFDRQHYSFNYVGQEFLGEIRCIAFDVKPLPKLRQWKIYRPDMG